ncbi:UNVERIFIED_CONTAM: hypothetical protein FKN15_056214 [Acipenser sinensis]
MNLNQQSPSRPVRALYNRNCGLRTEWLGSSFRGQSEAGHSGRRRRYGTWSHRPSTTADTKPGLQGEASPDLQRTTSTSTESTAPAPEHPVRNRVGVDTKLKFTIEPSLGKNGFQQWYDALKAVARLPTGIPKEWRKRDLHRTGCSSYCGQEAEQDRVGLKRVLLAYARWNKAVGYCQGFNVLAALILEVVEGNEGEALKVMIYLIDKVLPDSYFANNLRALSVDMAVFRDLLRIKLPELSQHLDHLQRAANRASGDLSIASCALQWYDALKAVARLPTGIPKEWRKRVWLTLADQYLHSISIDWDKTMRFAFNDRSNPDDDTMGIQIVKVWLTLADQYLHSISIDWDKTMRFAFNDRSNPDDDTMGIQIVKDLHRTGCSSYCGQEAEQDRVGLKRVLLAYARWNKAVGYCQGFNVLAALILEVVEGNEGEALKLPIVVLWVKAPAEVNQTVPVKEFLVCQPLVPSRHWAQLDSVCLTTPFLNTANSAHCLQLKGSYEPPLTNVFTMQWFLTMFATCLPNHTVLQIWDSVFFEGSEVLLRVALAIWAKLGERIENCQSSDEFYSMMGCLAQEAEMVYSMAVFPFPHLAELREKYTYNITPFPAPGKLGKSRDSDEEIDLDDEDSLVSAVGCLGPFSGLLAPELQRYQKHLTDHKEVQSLRSSNIAELSPGAIDSSRNEYQATFNSMMMERMTTDISALKRQYSRIKRRQQQQANLVYIKADHKEVQSLRSSNIAELSPGAIDSSRNEYQATFNSMMMERMTTDISALKRQYSRIKRRQQQQANLVYIKAGTEDEPNPGIMSDPSSQARNAMENQGPTTSLLPSQIHHSPVMNHLLLGKKLKQTQKGSRNNTMHIPGAKPAPLPHEDMKTKLNSPWRTHVRVHRKNLARARGQLSYGDTIGLIEEPGEQSPKPGGDLTQGGSEKGGREKEEGDERQEEEKEEEKEKERPVEKADGQSPVPAYRDANITEVQHQLEALELSSSTADPELPRCQRKASDSSGSENGGSSTPKTQPFYPFPSVKPPRKSAAARNLGLYGPMSRTPTVHFPHMSKNVNQISNGGSGTKKR